VEEENETIMFKKIMVVFTAFMLVFASVGFLSVDTADAKGYKSGKKSYDSKSTQTDKSKVDKKEDNNVNAKKTTPETAKSNKGGFMKGMLLGGLGGLLLGSLFADMGILGSILAFMVNALVMAGIVLIAIRIFKHFKDKRKKKVEEAAWKQ
jgi:predicted lipid-binding transport protein (Tim44 family)